MQTLVPHTLLSSPGLCAIAHMDRAIQYAAASPYRPAASGILDPRFRGDDSGNCFSRSNVNELK
ncbi:MAG: hypothetical protein ACI9HH_001727 [Pseudomonadota bacterium]|jgi:hypothetical protein